MFMNTPDGDVLTEDDRITCESPNTATDSELTELIIKQLQTLSKRRPHILIVIDEIDALSKTDSSKLVFKRFI